MAIDAKESGKRRLGNIYSWRNAQRVLMLSSGLKNENFRAGELLVTSMDRDGTKKGFDIQLTSTISEAVDIPVIASGGVGNLGHLVEGLIEGKADAVLAASIFTLALFHL